MSTAPTANSKPATRSRHPRTFSPSALRIYDECPRRYAYQYLQRPPVPDPASAQLVFGNAIHGALAQLYRVPPAERNEATAHRGLRHSWARERGRDQAFLSKEEEAEWGRKALDLLSDFCRQHADELAIKPLAIEEWVRAALPSGRSVSGKLDRAERITVPDPASVDPETGELPAEGGTLEVLRVTDYKTGRCHFADGDELAGDRSAQIYALAARRSFGIPLVQVRYLYLTENRALTWQVADQDLIEVQRRLDRDIKVLLADPEYEARPGFWCRWCKYRPLCPEGSGPISVDDLDADPGTVF